MLNPAYTGNLCTAGWYKVAKGGSNGATYDGYLTLNTNQSSQAGYSASYSVKVTRTGWYKIEAYVVNHTAINWSCPTKTISWDTQQAPFRIVHENGTTNIFINQRPYANQFVTVGVYYFVAGKTYSVKVTDLNGESNLSTTISVSTIKISWDH